MSRSLAAALWAKPAVYTLLLWLALASLAVADPLTDVLARMDKASQQFKAMTADITDLEHTAVVNDDSTMKGAYKVRRSKGETRMLIDFTSPDAKTISLEGSQVKVYYPKLKLVQVYNVGDKRNIVDDFLLLGVGASGAELKASYEVTYIGDENIGGQAASHLKLIPKSAEILKQLKVAELWIADSSALAGFSIQQKYTTSAAGDYKLVTYSNVKLNPPMSDSDMKLKTPGGVQIQQMQK